VEGPAVARTIVLIPSSKGKEAGGRAPAYGDSEAVRDHPLAEPRREVLAALEQAAEKLDDKGIARLCGVDPELAEEHRRRLASLRRGPTLPAHRRYTGIVHDNAGLPDIEPSDAVDIGILGGLLGVAWMADPVPDYRVEVTGRVPELGVLGTWWRESLVQHLAERADGRRVWDLLPGEHARMWPDRRRADLDVVSVSFQRPDGRAAPSASTKVAKGRLLQLLLEDPGVTPQRLARDRHIEGWALHAGDTGLTVVQEEA
jgi:uncharacterized protein